MAHCDSCAKNIPDESEYCLHCGSAQDSSRLATIEAQSPPISSSGSIDGARFVPGSMVENRYRIVGMLGKGGMGEVYRAEDLKLGQPVALKFLPARSTREETSVARLRREVAIARQIAHPNVCRVFDIVESEGFHFLTMEFIDGEDLASLLRRIGRLPSDKAVQIAQQLCAGLAVAHEAGVLHRDLKPANIMLDGRGRARITDFGLAHLARDSAHSDPLEGTAVYMAPEQLAGNEPTVQSDLYSLGLVLYEIFTGKRLFTAKTVPDLIRQQQQTTPEIPDSVARDMDPAVERVIIRCLDRDPQQRPSSVLQVAAALPGGDPLAAALAAGETPSPELVAAAAKEGALGIRTGSLLLCFILLELIAVLIVSKDRLYNRLAINKPPAVLVDRAQSILGKLGYPASPADLAWGFQLDNEFLRYARKQNDKPVLYERMERGQPPTLYFWYRQSPHSLTPSVSTQVTWSDPPMTLPGMVNLALDPQGRLIEFHAVPSQQAKEENRNATKPDWNSVFSEAGIEITKFSEAQPEWIPPNYADLRAAWEGSYPDQPGIPVRIEAATCGGNLVSLQMIPPWKRKLPEEQITMFADENPRSSGQRTALGIGTVVYFTAIIAAIFLARRNLRLGRGDRKGAFRVALFMLIVVFIGSVLKGHHAFARRVEMNVFFESLTAGLRSSAFWWLFYIALEPYVRRLRPGLLISWTRLISGDFRNPMVGRDVLIGGLLASTMALLSFLYYSFIEPGTSGTSLNPDTLLGMRTSLGVVLHDVFAPGVQFGMYWLFLLLLFFTIFRKTVPALAGTWLIVAVMSIAGALAWPLAAVFAALVTLAVSRFGLLTSISFYTLLILLGTIPVSSDFARWYAVTGITFLLGIGVILVFCFHIATGDKALFRDSLLARQSY